MITWFTGQSGAGKTTAALAHQRVHGGVLLDGDSMRAVWPGLGFSADDRWTQNIRIARLALLLTTQGCDVIVASICPFKGLREACDVIAGGIEWVWVTGGRETDTEHPYEAPMDERVRVLQGAH